jgi:DNA-binding NarL/FixJ family response regulator
VITVVVADDQALVRGGFRMILETQPDIEVVAEAEDGVEALEQVAAHRPDVVLMDVRMPRLDGVAATRRILAEHPGTRVLVLTTFDEDEIVYDAFRAGASGFLLKTVPPARLADAVRTIAAGEELLAPTVTRRLIETFLGRSASPMATPELEQLTERERQVLELIGRGLSNREIADHFVLSEATVKTHVNRVFTKLQLRDRVQAVVLAYESGLVRPGERPEAR